MKEGHPSERYGSRTTGSLLVWPAAVAFDVFYINCDTMLHPNSSVEAWIRSKYEYKRWVMKGPIPDPATLDDGDDETIVVRTLPILIISL